MIRDITIRTIPEWGQRYKTSGDYWTDKNGVEQIRVSQFDDWRYGALIAIHELVETVLCRDRGIKTEDIDKFDMAFEDKGEPGDSPNSPYYREHQFASAIERLMCNELGIPWHEYDKEVG